MKTFIAIGSLVILLVALMFISVRSAAVVNPPFEIDKIHPLDKVQGNASSSVLIVEYSDFQCPACRIYYGITKQLMVKYEKDVALVYRHFPLTEIHPNAEFAARAAEAAGKQGKFWQMHDLLFEKQSEWSNVADIQSLFENYAKLLGISVEQFRTDFLSNDIKNLVRAERSFAMKIGLNATPTFFINGKQIKNPSSVEEFDAIINEAIKSKK